MVIDTGKEPLVMEMSMTRLQWAERTGARRKWGFRGNGRPRERRSPPTQQRQQACELGGGWELLATSVFTD